MCGCPCFAIQDVKKKTEVEKKALTESLGSTLIRVCHNGATFSLFRNQREGLWAPTFDRNIRYFPQEHFAFRGPCSILGLGISEISRQAT